MVERKQVVFGDNFGGASSRPEDIIKLYEKGWERDPDVPYNGMYGPKNSKIVHLIKYTEEEKAEREALKQGAGPLNVVDVNITSVPILKYSEIENGVKNPYAELTAKGWKEIHRTSKEAILKLTDPCGVLLPPLCQQRHDGAGRNSAIDPKLPHAADRY